MKKCIIPLLFFFCSLSAHAQIITTIAGDSTYGYNGDNIPAIDAALSAPSFIALDGVGNVYFTDRDNNRIRKINSSGIITTIAGTGVAGYNGDSISATNAEINSPVGIAFDGVGNLYFADDANNRIRMINTSGIITTIAGNGSQGFSGDGSPATVAEFHSPSGIALDSVGNIYVADIGNNCIRKINAATNGIITTIAGAGGIPGNSGDGGLATAARIFEPYGITLDATGNIYFADFLNSNIRKINTAGIISTIAGTGTAGYNGDNIAATTAKLNQPSGVFADSKGNLYVADGYNYRIRKISPATSNGIITTIAGNGSIIYSGDGGLATLAGVAATGVTLDEAANIYIADFSHCRIRFIKNTTAINILNNGTNEIHINPNPANGDFTINIKSANEDQAQLLIVNAVGEKIKEVNTVTNQPIDIHLDVPAGVYFVIATTATQRWSGRVVIIR